MWKRRRGEDKEKGKKGFVEIYRNRGLFVEATIRVNFRRNGKELEQSDSAGLFLLCPRCITLSSSTRKVVGQSDSTQQQSVHPFREIQQATPCPAHLTPQKLTLETTTTIHNIFIHSRHDVHTDGMSASVHKYH